MPYISEKIRLSGLQDRRKKLTDEQREQIKEEYGTGLIGLLSLSKKYNVSKKLIHIIVNPEVAEKSKQRIKDNWKNYQQFGEDRAKAQRDTRRYKQELFLKGELKEKEK